MNAESNAAESLEQAATAGVAVLGTHSGRKREWSVKRLLAEGARDWNLPQNLLTAICSVPFVIALAGILTALISKDLYKWFTGEDRFAENGQVLFYFLAFVLCLVIARRLWRTGQKEIACLYLCLSFGLFFLVGEELSWGQRIFGWGTPESLKAVNKQGEANLHNIYGVGATFKWIQLLVGAYGTFLPLLLLRSHTLARYRHLLSRVIPHFTLIPYFFFMFMWRVYRNFMEPPKRFYFVVEEYNEVIELILSLGFFLFMVFQMRGFNGHQPLDQSGRGSRARPLIPH